MLKSLSSVTRRVVYGVFGAAFAVRHEPKDVFTTFALLVSPHTAGLSIEIAIEISKRARLDRVDPFDLWMLYELPECDSLEQAVAMALQMRAFFEISDDPLGDGDDVN